MTLFSRLTLICALFSVATASNVPEAPYTGSYISGAYSVTWTHSLITDVLTFTVTSPIGSWSEVGFSNKINSGHDAVDSIMCFSQNQKGVLLAGNSIPGDKSRHRVDTAPLPTLVSFNTVGATQTCTFDRPRTAINLEEDITLVIPKRNELARQYLVWAWGTNIPEGCINNAVCPEGNTQLAVNFPYKYANHGAINRGSNLVRFFDPLLQPTEAPTEGEPQDMGTVYGIAGAGAAVILGSAAYFVTGNKKPAEMSRVQFARASMGFGGGGARTPSAFGPGFGAAPGAMQGGAPPPPPPGMGMGGNDGSFNQGGSFSAPPALPPPKPAGMFARASALMGGVGGRMQTFGNIAMNRVSMAPQSFGFGGPGGGGNQAGYMDKQPSSFQSYNGGGGGGQWKTTTDPNTGVSYYYNKVQNRSTWKKPQGVAGL